MAELAPCLVVLRAEFNQLIPDRPKGADGWIGDTAHAARKSDHNPDGRGLVHAIDITLFPELEAFVQFVLTRCRSGAETRLTYVIFRRRIWEASNGWRERAYTLVDPHTGHAHFSASSTPARERNTNTWHLEDIPVALTTADKSWLVAQIREAVGELTASTALKGADGKPDGTASTTVGNRVLSQGIPNPFEGGDRSPAYVVIGDIAEAVKTLVAAPPAKP